MIKKKTTENNAYIKVKKIYLCKPRPTKKNSCQQKFHTKKKKTPVHKKFISIVINSAFEGWRQKIKIMKRCQLNRHEY